MNFISAADLAWWSDYDGVIQDPTVRILLPDNAQKSLLQIARKAGFACIITNSDPAGVESTLCEDVMKAGMVLIGEHGSVAKFDHRSEYEFHPDLTVDRSVLPELFKRAIDILEKYGMPWTVNGADLYLGENVVKPEQKMASFALVRAQEGYGSGNLSIERMNAVIEQTMETLASEFGLVSKGWVHYKGLDAQEFAQKGMSKQSGIEWAMRQCADRIGSDSTHFVHEDSNPGLLKWMHQTHDAFNIAVGNNLPEGDYIFKRVPGIQEFLGLAEAVANDFIGLGGLRLDTVSRYGLPSPQPRRMQQ